LNRNNNMLFEATLASLSATATPFAVADVVLTAFNSAFDCYARIVAPSHSVEIGRLSSGLHSPVPSVSHARIFLPGVTAATAEWSGPSQLAVLTLDRREVVFVDLSLDRPGLTAASILHQVRISARALESPEKLWEPVPVESAEAAARLVDSDAATEFGGRLMQATEGDGVWVELPSVLALVKVWRPPAAEAHPEMLVQVYSIVHFVASVDRGATRGTPSKQRTNSMVVNSNSATGNASPSGPLKARAAGGSKATWTVVKDRALVLHGNRLIIHTVTGRAVKCIARIPVPKGSQVFARDAASVMVVSPDRKLRLVATDNHDLGGGGEGDDDAHLSQACGVAFPVSHSSAAAVSSRMSAQLAKDSLTRSPLQLRWHATASTPTPSEFRVGWAAAIAASEDDDGTPDISEVVVVLFTSKVMQLQLLAAPSGRLITAENVFGDRAAPIRLPRHVTHERFVAAFMTATSVRAWICSNKESENAPAPSSPRLAPTSPSRLAPALEAPPPILELVRSEVTAGHRAAAESLAALNGVSAAAVVHSHLEEAVASGPAILGTVLDAELDRMHGGEPAASRLESNLASARSVVVALFQSLRHKYDTCAADGAAYTILRESLRLGLIFYGRVMTMFQRPDLACDPPLTLTAVQTLIDEARGRMLPPVSVDVPLLRTYACAAITVLRACTEQVPWTRDAVLPPFRDVVKHRLGTSAASDGWLPIQALQPLDSEDGPKPNLAVPEPDEFQLVTMASHAQVAKALHMLQQAGHASPQARLRDAVTKCALKDITVRGALTDETRGSLLNVLGREGAMQWLANTISTTPSPRVQLALTPKATVGHGERRITESILRRRVHALLYDSWTPAASAVGSAPQDGLLSERAVTIRSMHAVALFGPAMTRDTRVFAETSIARSRQAGDAPMLALAADSVLAAQTSAGEPCSPLSASVVDRTCPAYLACAPSWVSAAPLWLWDAMVWESVIAHTLDGRASDTRVEALLLAVFEVLRSSDPSGARAHQFVAHGAKRATVARDPAGLLCVWTAAVSLGRRDRYLSATAGDTLLVEAGNACDPFLPGIATHMNDLANVHMTLQVEEGADASRVNAVLRQLAVWNLHQGRGSGNDAATSALVADRVSFHDKIRALVREGGAVPESLLADATLQWSRIVRMKDEGDADSSDDDGCGANATADRAILIDACCAVFADYFRVDQRNVMSRKNLDLIVSSAESCVCLRVLGLDDADSSTTTDDTTAAGAEEAAAAEEFIALAAQPGAPPNAFFAQFEEIAPPVTSNDDALGGEGALEDIPMWLSLLHALRPVTAAEAFAVAAKADDLAAAGQWQIAVSAAEDLVNTWLHIHAMRGTAVSSELSCGWLRVVAAASTFLRQVGPPNDDALHRAMAELRWQLNVVWRPKAAVSPAVSSSVAARNTNHESQEFRSKLPSVRQAAAVLQVEQFISSLRSLPQAWDVTDTATLTFFVTHVLTAARDFAETACGRPDLADAIQAEAAAAFEREGEVTVAAALASERRSAGGARTEGASERKRSTSPARKQPQFLLQAGADAHEHALADDVSMGLGHLSFSHLLVVAFGAQASRQTPLVGADMFNDVHIATCVLTSIVSSADDVNRRAELIIALKTMLDTTWAYVHSRHVAVERTRNMTTFAAMLEVFIALLSAQKLAAVGTALSEFDGEEVSRQISNVPALTPLCAAVYSYMPWDANPCGCIRSAAAAHTVWPVLITVASASPCLGHVLPCVSQLADSAMNHAETAAHYGTVRFAAVVKAACRRQAFVMNASLARDDMVIPSTTEGLIQLLAQDVPGLEALLFNGINSKHNSRETSPLAHRDASLLSFGNDSVFRGRSETVSPQAAFGTLRAGRHDRAAQRHATRGVGRPRPLLPHPRAAVAALCDPGGAGGPGGGLRGTAAVGPHRQGQCRGSHHWRHGVRAPTRRRGCSDAQRRPAVGDSGEHGRRRGSALPGRTSHPGSSRCGAHGRRLPLSDALPRVFVRRVCQDLAARSGAHRDHVSGGMAPRRSSAAASCLHERGRAGGHLRR
jgi:hypothetical protein